MKIALVSTMIFPVPPRGYGGLEGCVEDLAIELIKMGHKVSIVCPKGSEVPGAELIMPCEPSMWGNPEGQAYAAYKERLEAGDWDICHDHSWDGFPYLSKMKNPKLKLIHTIHSQKPWNKLPAVTFPCLTGASKFQAQLLSSTYGCRAEYVYHGINLDTYKFREAKEDFLLYVARVTPFKGAHEFVALCKRLHMRGHLVGEDVYVDDQGFVRRVMDSCDGQQVIYEGRLGRGSDLLVEMMGKARAVVAPLLPDYWEIFGLSTIESMACGTPFISTDRGAARELITEGTGFVIPDIHGLDEAVKNLDKCSAQACRRQAERFDRKFMSEGWVKLYERVLNGDAW